MRRLIPFLPLIDVTEEEAYDAGYNAGRASWEFIAGFVSTPGFWLLVILVVLAWIVRRSQRNSV
jgi:hypothetical protein